MSKKKLEKVQEKLVYTIGKQIRKLKFEHYEVAQLSDQSGYYIELKRKDLTLSISFDETGNEITHIGVFKDVVQVIDIKQIF